MRIFIRLLEELCRKYQSASIVLRARTPEDAALKGAPSRAGAGCKSVLPTLLTTIAVFAACVVSAHAQTRNWTGQSSSEWFFIGNWDTGFPRQTDDANINTVTPFATVISSPGALARNLTVGANGTGALTIQTGGTLADSFATIGNLPGGLGAVTVTGAGSSWSTAGSIVVGGQGTGTLTIQDGGAVTSGGGSVGLSAGSNGTVTVTGPGSSWTNGPSGGLNIGSFGTGTLMIANGGRVINFAIGTAATIGNGAGSHGTATVTGAGSIWINTLGLNVGNLGTGTLTIADGGVVAGPVVIATRAGSIGTLNIGAAAGSPAVAPGTLTSASVVFGAGTGTLNFNHSSANYVFAPAIRGNGTVNVLAGTTILTGANSYGGPTNVNAGTLRAGALNTFSRNSAVTVASAGTLDLNGFNQTLSIVANAGLVSMGVGTAPGTILTTASYTGTGGTIALNTFLGGDGSPSDKLVVDEGRARGNSFLRVTNVGGPGAETTGNGILVVEATNGATTAPGAFALSAGELRAGAFDYDLFRGGVSASPDDWFLRSDFVVGPGPGPGPLPPGASLPVDPPPEPLPPGIYPIIGPELATYGVVQPLARQLGLTILGTLDDRVGDTYEPDDNCTVESTVAPGALLIRKPGVAPVPCPLFAPSVWGRFFGQTIDNHYRAFADPRADGNLGGFQAGVDLLRGSLFTGHSERAGLYAAYGAANVSVDGLVTNPAATAYSLGHTGSVHLDAWSGGAYWTHTGPSGWYLDAVLQGTSYGGSASTAFAKLDTNGWGFLTSLEGGYPFSLPPFGPEFEIEPQAQIVWQQVSFDQHNDGLGDVALGDTTGTTGRIGLRAKWRIVTAGGQIWQPYLRANLWENWGARSNTVYAGTDTVPLQTRGTLLQLGGGVTAKLNANVSLFANADYEFTVGGSGGEKQNGVRGTLGARYTW
jgi:outer membrane autotransporter protein